MIKQLIAKYKSKKINNNSKFSLNSLYALNIPCYETYIVETQYGADAAYKKVDRLAIFTGKPYIHIRSKKSLKDILNIKNVSMYTSEFKPLIELEQIKRYMRKNNLSATDKITYDEVMALEDNLNTKNKNHSNNSTFSL